MAAPQVKESEVDTLLNSGNLSVEGEHTWKQHNEKSWYKIALPVKCDTKKGSYLRIHRMETTKRDRPVNHF
jgi:hypothetical protein